MKTLVLAAVAAGAIALFGMFGASAAPGNGIAIGKAAIGLLDVQQVRYRRHVRHYYWHHRHYYWTYWGYQPRYEPFFRLGPVWCC